MGARLEQFGWSTADAAWAMINWPPLWLAAAIANEREKRGLAPAPLPFRRAGDNTGGALASGEANL